MNMKNLKHYLYTLIFSGIFIFASCSKVLSPLPEQILINDSAITSVKDLNSVLNGAYDALQSGNVLTGNMSGYADLLADDAAVFEERLSPFGTQEIYNGQTTVQLGAIRGMWADCYRAINRANYVIDAVENNARVQADPTFNANKDRIKGEALAIRGIVHFELMKFWALPYNIQNPSENTKPQSGVVLRTQPTKEFNPDASKSTRSTIEECYTQIIKDLEDASLLLNANAFSGDRISGDATKAMLSRVYFFKGDYEKSRNFANQVIVSNRYALADSIRQFFRQAGVTTINAFGGGTKPEAIFQLINNANDNANSLPFAYSLNAGGWFYLDEPVFAQRFITGDLRRSLFTGGIRTSTKYLRATGAVGAVVEPNVFYIRLAEMLLNRAECNVLLNDNLSQALADYNLIRQRAFKTNFVEETSTDGLLDKIRNERRRELMFEVGDRYMNLRRLQLPLRKTGPEGYTQFLFKIPQEEISANPDLQQN